MTTEPEVKPRVPRGPNCTKKEIREIKRMHREGHSNKAIAQAFDVSEATVSRHTKGIKKGSARTTTPAPLKLFSQQEAEATAETDVIERLILKQEAKLEVLKEIRAML